MSDIVTIEVNDTVTGTVIEEHVVEVGYSLPTGSSLSSSGGTVTGPVILLGSPPLEIPAGAAAGKVLTSDDAGNVSWGSLPASLPPSGSASGDLSGAYPAPEVTGTHLAEPLPVAQGGTGASSAAAALAALGAAAADSTTDWVNAVTSYAADPTGVADSTTAIQNAISALPSGGGVVYLPTGIYKIDLGALTPVSFLRLTGDGAGSTTLVSTANSLINAGASATDTVEIDHLTLECTGADIFTGANCTRWSVHDCRLIQNSAGNAIWNAPAVALMIECRFERNSEYISGSTRTIEAWFLSAPNNNQQVNQNVWRDGVCINQGRDASEFWYHIQAAGTGGVTTAVNVSNSFENMVFEKPYGGGIWVESGINTTIDECLSWDTSSGDGVNQAGSFVYFSKNTNGQACVNQTVRNSGRNGAQVFASSAVSDIELDANCSQTLIENPRGNSGIWIDLGNSAKINLLALPSTYTLRNSGSATYADAYINRQGTTAAAAPLGSAPTAPTSTVSTTLVMMGLGTNATGTPWAFTPASSGKVVVTVTGLVTTATAVATATVGGRYGTGTAPSNGAAVTGTRFGAAGDLATRPQQAGTGVPFALTAVLSLTPGTAYWFDLALDTSSGSDAASVADVSISIVETS